MVTSKSPRNILRWLFAPRPPFLTLLAPSGWRVEKRFGSKRGEARRRRRRRRSGGRERERERGGMEKSCKERKRQREGEGGEQRATKSRPVGEIRRRGTEGGGGPKRRLGKRKRRRNSREDLEYIPTGATLRSRTTATTTETKSRMLMREIDRS